MNSAGSIRQQQGAVLVLTVLCLFVLMGVAGLAIDIGHTLVNKTIEQNAADAAAMSAAIRLNEQNDPTNSNDEVAAEAAGKATYNLFKTLPGNGQISAKLADSDFNFTFTNSTDLSASPTWTSASATLDANFVRVATNNMVVNTWFAGIGFPGISGFPAFNVSSSAVAGFVPISPCNLAPLMLCAENPALPDKNCNDGACFGYTINNIYCLTPNKSQSGPNKCAASGNSSWGPGNIGFVNLGGKDGVFPDLSPGADTLGACLGKAPACQDYCENSPVPNTLPPFSGNAWGKVEEGLEEIFRNSSKPNPTYSLIPDSITGWPANGSVTNSAGQSSTLTYLDWAKISSFTSPAVTQIPLSGLSLATLTSNGVSSPYAIYKTLPPPKRETNLPSSAEYKKRIINVPFVDCTNPPNGTSSNLTVVGFGCFLLTAKAEKTASEEFILGQFIEDQHLCQSTGTTTSTGNSGFDKVMLYKDPSGGHS
jgi:Flp pilus assembly protein TadG